MPGTWLKTRRRGFERLPIHLRPVRLEAGFRSFKPEAGVRFPDGLLARQNVGERLLRLVGGLTGQSSPPRGFGDDVKFLPENIADLRAMEKQVQAVLEKVMPCTVGVLVGPGQGSGVIVNAEGIVLTAGHVSMTAPRALSSWAGTGAPVRYIQRTHGSGTSRAR